MNYNKINNTLYFSNEHGNNRFLLTTDPPSYKKNFKKKKFKKELKAKNSFNILNNPKNDEKFPKINNNFKNVKKTITAQNEIIKNNNDENIIKIEKKNFQVNSIRTTNQKNNYFNQEIIEKKLNSLDDFILGIQSILKGKYEIYELDILTKTFKQLSENFKESVYNDLEYNKKIRENNKLKQDNLKLTNLLSLENKTSHNLRDDKNLIKHNLDLNMNKINKLNKLWMEEKKKSLEFKNKIQVLEKRIEIILDSSEQIIPQEDLLRVTLTEVLKENEKLKRDVNTKNKEINKLIDEKSQIKINIKSLNNKIKELKQEKGIVDKVVKNEKVNIKNYENDIEIMTNIPLNLDFIDENCKEEIKGHLGGLFESGANSFSQYLLTYKDEISNKQILLCNIIKHLLIYKNFGNNINKAITFLSNINDINNVKEFMINLSGKLKGIYGNNNICLWKLESMDGLFYTYDDTNKLFKVLCNKGLISEVFKLREPLYKKANKEFYIYKFLNGVKEFSRNILFFPILINNEIEAIIEFKDIEESNFLEVQYINVIISNIFKNFIQNLNFKNLKKFYNDRFNTFLNFYGDIYSKNNLFEYSNFIVNFLKNFFKTNMCNFYFCHDNKIKKYLRNEIFKEFNSNIGIIGYVSQNLKPYIYIDYNSNNIFNKMVDIQSLLPVITYPIIHNNKLLYIIQIVINEKNYKLNNEISKNSINITYEFQNILNIIKDLILRSMNKEIFINLINKEFHEKPKINNSNSIDDLNN